MPETEEIDEGGPAFPPVEPEPETAPEPEVEGPPDAVWDRKPTTVLHLRKSYSVKDLDDDGNEQTEELLAEVLDPETGAPLLDEAGNARTYVRGHRTKGSKPRYRWFPEFVPAGNVRPESPPAYVTITQALMMDLLRCGQIEDGQVVLDGGSLGTPIAYSIGEVPEGGHPDEIPLTLVSEV